MAIYVRTNDRKLKIIKMLLSGVPTMEVAKAENVGRAAILHILHSFCSEYLLETLQDGTPETFYPGGDTSWNRYENEGTDITRNRYRGVRNYDNWTGRISPSYEDITEIRKYKDYWLHQVELLEKQRRAPKAKYQG